MTAFWLNVMWMMAAQLYWEKDQATWSSTSRRPISMMSILLGMAVGGLLATCFRASVVLVIGTWRRRRCTTT